LGTRRRRPRLADCATWAPFYAHAAPGPLTGLGWGTGVRWRLFQALGLFAQFGALALQRIDPPRQARADAWLELPRPFLAHVSAAALKVFHAGVVALIDDGPDGVQAEAGFLGLRAATCQPCAF
jgi:hypothetical protein